jgi:putative tricarboxylic transport membrane protein
MYIGNGMLLLLNLPLIGIWVRVLKIPIRILFPLILLFCLIGSYAVNNSVFDIIVMIIFGVVGYILRKFKYEEAPLLLAFILGPMLEQAFRQSLVMSSGDLSIFLIRPISCIAILLSFALLFSTVFNIFWKARTKISKIENNNND